MSKILNVTDGDYKVKVQPSGTITLDTGEQGLVLITGNLQVTGEVTAIQTTNTEIEDNIIILNRGEAGSGVSEGASGIRIDRGNISDMQWLFVEDVAWTDTQNPGTVDVGAWSPRSPQDRVVGIETVSIVTPGVDLNLLGVYNTGSALSPNYIPNPGKLTVLGTTDYEQRVVHDDDIPNKKYVDDEIAAFFSVTFQDRIRAGTFAGSQTSVQAFDDSITGFDSHVQIGIDGILVADFYRDRADIQDIRIQGSLIETTTSNDDLVLSATGAGSVVIDDNMTLTKTPGIDALANDPGFPVDGIKMYSKSESTGGTGLFFVNETNRRDEIISRNRALVFSMLF